MKKRKRPETPPPPPVNPETSTDPQVNHGPVKTSMRCTNCTKGFVAELDFGIDGDHEILCPHCGHEHCRRIEKGRITDFRWSTRPHTERVRCRRMWKSDLIAAETGSASDFIRRRWLETVGGG